MARKYSNTGLLEYETFAAHVDIHIWLESIIKEQGDLVKMWEFLNNSGRYFDTVLSHYPVGISIPTDIERGYCHQNNIKYAKVLIEQHQDKVNDFRFITGLWLRKRKILHNSSECNYFIGGHSFMTYKGEVLDCTSLKYPPDFYEITQLFGVSFQLSDVVTAFDRIEKEKVDQTKIPVLEILRSTPYLKE